MPVVAFVNGRSPDPALAAALQKGMGETGTEGQSATVDYHWSDGQYDQLPSLMADLPIVFGIGNDPVKLGSLGIGP